MTPHPVRRQLRDQHGSISIMGAMLAVAMVMATSLAVDVGRVAYTSRDQQGVTDRAALDALRTISGMGEDETIYTPQDYYDAAVSSVVATMAGNEEGSAVGTSRDRAIEGVEVGYYDPACADSFCVVYDENGLQDGSGRPITSVRVLTESAVDYVFAFLDEAGFRDVHKTALATNRRHRTDCPASDPNCTDAEAGISVRSRLVELNTGNIAVDDPNLALVQDLLGELVALTGPTSVTAVGFDGLANADVPLSVLGDAGATVGTTDQLLDSQVTLQDLFTAMASGATSDDAAVTAQAGNALLTLAAEVDPALTVRVGDLLATSTEDPSALLTGQINALDLVMHVAANFAVANGNNFVALDLTGGSLANPLFGLDGLLDINATLHVIEGPQMAYGKVAVDPSTGEYVTVARTAQVEFSVDLTLNSYYADQLLGPLEDLISGLLCFLLPATCPDKTVGINLNAADAQAALTAIECDDPLSDSDLNTVVTSDTLVATVSGGSQTLVDTRSPSQGTVLIPEVPGEGATSVDNTVSLTNIAALDAELETILGMLGIDLGTAYVASHAIDCDVPVLLPTD